LAQFAAGPILVLPVDLVTALTAMNTSDAFGIDLTDAVLLRTSQAQGALWLATDDSQLARVCRQVGITPQTPIDVSLRQQMIAWESAHLPMKGLPRVLRQIHQWLNQSYPQTAEDFWSRTGGGSHLP
jgi:hypothetical protein